MIIKSLNKTLYFNGVPLLYGKYSKKTAQQEFLYLELVQLYQSHISQLGNYL